MATYSKVCSNVGSFTYGNRFTLYVVLTNRDGNPATNPPTSVVDYEVYFQNTSGGGTFTSQTRLYFALNGVVITDSTSSITGPRNGTVQIAKGSTTINHNDDGTKSISYHALVKSTNFGISGEISGTFALTTIPRASTITCSTANIESDATVSITSASTSFTHSVYAYFGTQYVVIAENQKGGSFLWKIPTSFYAQIPNAPQGQGTIYCETYSGGTYIGVVTAGFHVTTNIDKCRPTVTGTVVDTNSTTIALTGNKNKLVLGKSTAQITVTPVAKNSATIKTVKIDGVTTTNNTRTIANVSKASFPIEVTDSRGYSSTAYSATASGGSVTYVPLTFNATIFRPQPTGTEIQMTYSGKYFNDSFGAVANTLSITWKYRVKGESTWSSATSITPTLSGNTISTKTISLGTSYDYQTAYEFQITAVDKLTTITQTIQVSVGLPVFNWGKDYLNVNGDIRRNGMSTHYLYAQATTPTNGTPLEATDGGGELQHTKLCSIYDNNNRWWNMINLRHQNGEGGDGTKYGMQIIRPLTDLNGAILTRAQSNHIWTDWEAILRSKTLYNNTSGTTGTVTLNETSANFSYLEVYFAYGDYQDVIKVSNPNGFKFQAEISYWASGKVASPYRTMTSCYTISGTSITPSLRGYVDENGYLTTFDASIRVLKVVGYR